MSKYIKRTIDDKFESILDTLKRDFFDDNDSKFIEEVNRILDNYKDIELVDFNHVFKNVISDIIKHIIAKHISEVTLIDKFIIDATIDCLKFDFVYGNWDNDKRFPQPRIIIDKDSFVYNFNKAYQKKFGKLNFVMRSNNDGFLKPEFNGSYKIEIDDLSIMPDNFFMKAQTYIDALKYLYTNYAKRIDSINNIILS